MDSGSKEPISVWGQKNSLQEPLLVSVSSRPQQQQRRQHNRGTPFSFSPTHLRRNLGVEHEIRYQRFCLTKQRHSKAGQAVGRHDLRRCAQ